jgi:hypothetical protein
MSKRRVTIAAIVKGRYIQSMLKAEPWQGRWKKKSVGEEKEMQTKG